MGIKEEIDALESKVSKLRTDYEQYFARLIKREPLKLREEVERLILKYSNATITNTSFKFKYNSIVAKYNSFKQYWTRVLRAIEDGSYAVSKAAELPLSPAPAPRLPSEETTQPAASGHGTKDGRFAEVYRLYIEAKSRCNEPVIGITYESFLKTIEKSRQKVEEAYRTKDVELKVYIKDGKTKLAITPKK
ncbi:MAG: hypothetical protein HZB21_04320 [Deltaproteobacteria bacterium]|nr:hypothetical protein [Deltaproteobacteria bacterium]